MELNNVSYVDKAADLQTTQSSLFQHTWDYTFCKKCSITELNELKCITLNSLSTERDWNEEQQFPQIYNIILDWSFKLLKIKLDDNPDAICVMNAKGRTTLDWAMVWAQLSDIRLLITCGSPLNTMDVSGHTMVLHAVNSYNDNALCIVFEAGTNYNSEVLKGLFCSSLLIAASFGGLVGMIKLLIEFGAKVDECNPESQIVLQVVASIQNVECVNILLIYGINLNYILKNRHLLFMTMIMCNNHTVLKLFFN